MLKTRFRVLSALLALIIAALLPLGIDTQVKLANCTPPTNLETNNSGLAIKSLNIVETSPLFYGSSEKVALVDHTWLSDCDSSKELTLVPTGKTVTVDDSTLPVWDQSFEPTGKDWLGSLLIVSTFVLLIIAGVQVTIAVLETRATWTSKEGTNG